MNYALKCISTCFFLLKYGIYGLPWWLRWWRILLQCRRHGFEPWVGKIPCRSKWQSIPVFLPGEFHGQRSLVGYSPWGCKELDRTEWLTLSLLTLCCIYYLSLPHAFLFHLFKVLFIKLYVMDCTDTIDV